MMKTQDFILKENKCLCKNTYLLHLEGEIDYPIIPGQFYDIELPNFFLRRPFGVYKYDSKNLYFIYKVVGKGTQELSHLKEGTILNLLGPIGNGFTSLEEESLLLSGGLGFVPLFFLAKKLREENKSFHTILGFNSKDEVPDLSEFKELDPSLEIVTLDGSLGKKGLVFDVLEEKDYEKCAYGCGPLVMLKEIDRRFKKGYVSLEARMGCGYAICNGCSVKTFDERHLKVCKDGPVFKIKEVVYD